MDASLLSLIYVAGLAQAAFLVCALSALRVRHSSARWLLIAVIVVFSVLLTEELLDALGRSLRLGLGLAIEFALGPLLYFFMKALISDAPFSLQRSGWHFAPLLAASGVLIWLNVGFVGGVSLSHPAMRPIIASMVIIKIIYFFAYAGAALGLALPAEASASRLGALRNLRQLFAACVAIYGLNALSFIAFLAAIPLAPDSDAVGGVVLSISLYAIGYFSLVNREVFDLRDPYELAPLLSEEAARIRTRAASHLSATNAYLDPDFGSADLARALGLKPQRLSQALNADASGGFKALTNRYRIAAYRVARADAANRHKGALELAFESGFNSKATFYRALKATESGLAPSVASAPQLRRES